MITWTQWRLQDALSPVIEEFIFFNDFTITILIFITTFVVYVLYITMLNPFIHITLLEGQIIECVWTLVPAIVLVQIAVPSLTLLYILDESSNSQITLKAIAHQWYWSYEYTDIWGGSPLILFDSYITPLTEMTKKTYRLLDTDNRVTLPFNTSIRILVTSADVLHSWTIPSIGVKVDASPGRLNQLNFISYRPGLFYGQCSEICGANHRFMPISVEFISPLDFFWWSVSEKSYYF